MVARGFFAALVVTAALAAGAFLVMRFQEAAPADAAALLTSPDAHLLCRIAAWGAAIAAALSVLTAFIAFAIDEDDEDGVRRRRGFPKAVPFLFSLVSLALFWAMFDCGAPPESERVVSTPAIESPAAQTDETVIAEPPVIDETPPPAPQVYSGWRYEWPFMIPLIKEDGGYYRSEALAGARDALTPVGPGLQATLCGAAWVAVTGATSEEGPEARNLARSRVRALIAAETVARWLDAQPEGCARPFVFGVDLGQHVEMGAKGDGSDTDWQRRAVMIARQASPDASIDAAAARAELEAFLADEIAMRAVLGSARYGRAPHVVTP